MLLVCPTCSAEYEVADAAVGAGRKVRCRACATSWFQPPAGATAPVIPAALSAPAVAEAAPDPIVAEEIEPRRPRSRLWLVLLLVVLVVGLGIAAAILLFGRQEVAARFGLDEAPVPLGIEISREPDWRMIADGGQLFAVSGRIWNPTKVVQPVPDVRAELKDTKGRIVYAWTITRPVTQLAPGGSVSFDGAAVDVPPSSTHVSVTFAGAAKR